MNAEGKAEGKKVQESVSTELVIDIYKGFTIDERDHTQQPNKRSPRFFRVIAWIDKEAEYETEVVKSSGGVHKFKQRLVIDLESSAYKYIYVDLVREICKEDPGTSNGTVVMGRAKIPLPPWNRRDRFAYKVNLIGMNSDGCVVVKGYLFLSMQLHRYFLRHNY